MLKKSNLISGLALMLISNAGWAGTFTARVQPPEGDGLVHLSLKLSDARAQGTPDFSPLRPDFEIVGQQESQVQQIVNGATSTSTSWDLSLAPKRPGANVIPSLSVQTDEGGLSTAVIRAASASTPVAAQNLASPVGGAKGFLLTARADASDVYKNQRVVVTFDLTASRSLTDLQVGDWPVQDAIVEKLGEPREFREVKNGRERQGLRMSYAVTPLKAGRLELPPLVVRGQSPQASAQDPFDSFFGNDGNEDPFTQMQAMMQNFSKSAFAGIGPSRPVSIASRELTLTVQPPVPGIAPWLPARSLSLSETWGAQNARAGEPLIRTITVKASGVSARQLPALENQLPSNKDEKVYADPAKSIDSPDGLAQKTQSFTIIPQAAGQLKLPAVQIAWFDVTTHQERTAVLPSHVVTVQPGVSGANEPTMTAQPVPAPSLQQVVATPRLTKQMTPLKLGLLLGALFLLAFCFREYLLLREMREPSALTPVPEVAPAPIIRRADLDRCADTQGLLSFLQRYTVQKFGLPPSANLTTILNQFNLDSEKRLLAADFKQKLEGALYAGRSAEIEELKRDIALLIFQRPAKTGKARPCSALPEMNPS